MDADLDTLATALYVTIDDLLQQAPHLAQWLTGGHRGQAQRRRTGHPGGHAGPAGFTSEARWLRYAGRHLGQLFPYLPGQSGYDKRLRRTGELLRQVSRAIACDTTLWTDDVWVVDSTLVECGRSRETAKRSEVAGWATYGYCASHSRWFWLHLVCTLHGLPVAFALTGAKAVEREARCGSLSSRSTRPSRASWTWNATAAAPGSGSRSGSCSASWP